VDNNEELFDENLEQPIQGVPQPNSKKEEGFLSKAYDAVQGYRDSGGIKGMARNAIDNKKNEIKDNVKNKIDEKKDAMKGAINKKIDSKLPPSVREKKDAVKAKSDAIKNKVNDTKKKAQDIKNKPNELKQKLNEQAFRKGLSSAINLAAPGVGTAAEKLLDTEAGKPAVEAAKAASNPVSAVTEGTKKIVEIYIKKQVTIKLIVGVAAITTFLVLLIAIFSPVIKYMNIFSYFTGNSSGEIGIDAVDEDHRQFFELIESEVTTNKAMVVAVLTAAADNDTYISDSISQQVESCTEDEILSGSCITIEKAGVLTYSKNKMRRTIKKVDEAILNSNNDVSEGNYNNPENSGSTFFRWLYTDFVGDYYKDYANTDKSKKDIIKNIYIYYDEINKNTTGNSSYISTVCTNGVTVEGDKTYSLDEYVAGVVAHENYYSVGNNIEAMKAQAVAARTFTLKMTSNCTKSIENSTNAQTFYQPTKVNSSYPLAKKAAEETSGEVLTYDGDIILAQYDAFYGTCSGDTCSATYTKLPVETKHTFSVPISYIPEYARNYFGHGRGMSQYGARWLQSEKNMNYVDILKYFYSDGVQISKMGATLVGDLYAVGASSGIMSESLFPINKDDISKIYKSAGWIYPSGNYHGAVDFASLEGGLASHSIAIYASHDGVVTRYFNQNCNAYSISAAKKTNLLYVPGCRGKQIAVTVQTGEYKGYTFYYAHLSNLAEGISDGAEIKAGQLIGYMGNTGNSTGPHLHFQVKDANSNDVNINFAIDEFLKNYK